MPHRHRTVAVNGVAGQSGEVVVEEDRMQQGDVERRVFNRSACSRKELHSSLCGDKHVGAFIARHPLTVLIHSVAEARPTYNESTVQRKPMLVKSTAKFDEGAEQQSLKDFLEDEDGGGRLDAMMIEDDFNIPVVLEEGQLRWSVNGGTNVNRSYLHALFVAAKDVKKYPVSLADFFQRTTPQLFLIQLPDTLPGQGNELVSAKKSDDAPSTAEADSEASGTQVR